ncbi:recombinase family protein [Streptomyces sp. NPDC093084]|uniref:recombinase family protein n=1 Tax=Streptomyces sp. NPDC093084 TaxID=3155197 RepID=UPI003429A0BA
MTNSSTAAQRVAIYVRVATAAEQSHALKAQEDACRLYADAQGWTVADVYRDLGVSGMHTARPGFARLLEDADAGLVDQVLVYRFDRVARTPDVFFSLLDALRLRHLAITVVQQDLTVH